MKISDILKETQIVADLRASNKEGILDELSRYACEHDSNLGVGAAQIAAALYNREHLGSTGVGEGVAIPHAKVPGLRALTAVFGRTKPGIPFDAIDHQPVHLVFVLLVPENSAGAHLKALARISRLLKNADFRDQLLTLPTADALYRAFIEEDEKH